MDHASRGRFPVDAFHSPCIARFYCALRSFRLASLQHAPLLVSVQRLIYGFIYSRDQPGGPAAYFSDISIPGNVAKVFIHTLNVCKPVRSYWSFIHPQFTFRG